MAKLDIVDTVINHWRANAAVLFFVTEEPFRVWRDVTQAAKTLLEKRNNLVQVVGHDKISGFYTDGPSIETPKLKTNIFVNALNWIIEPWECLAERDSNIRNILSNPNQHQDLPPFDPKQDLICVMRDPTWDLNEASHKAASTQILRNIIQHNMCSPTHYIDDSGEPVRGKRMLIFVSPTEKLPTDIPEINPIIVPLPEDEMLATTFEPLQIADKVTPEARSRIVAAMRGLTYQKAEDALALALIEHDGKLDDVEALTNTIRRKKAQMIEGIPGVTYVFHDDIPFDHLPGMEELEEFIDRRMAIPPNIAKQHNITPLKGITLAGVPGCGKTLVSKVIIKRTGRDGIFVDFGTIKEGLVGASQRNLRRVLNIIRALNAVAIFDDIDKGSTSTSASGYSGDGGTSAEMVSMLLTEMDGGANTSSESPIYIFTMNRTNNVPSELLRAGRTDAQFFVDKPDADTRLRIFNLHLTRQAATCSDDRLKNIVEFGMDQWTSAEVAICVNEAVIHAIAKGRSEIDLDWLQKEVANTTPMAKNNTYKQDWEEMEIAASQFRHIGKTSTANTQPAKRHQRSSKRSIN